MFVSKYQHQLQPEKIRTGKKRYSHLAGYAFRPTGKTYDQKKKVQSSDRWLKTICRVKIQTHKLRLEKNMTGKIRYDTVIWLSVMSK